MNNYTRDTNSRSFEVIKRCKKIVITGGVGVGKTTTIDYIKQIYLVEEV